MDKPALSAGDFARLVEASHSDLQAWRAFCEAKASWPENLDSHFDGHYRYSDALAVEVARQLSENNGICAGPRMEEAIQFAAYAGAVAFYLEDSAAPLSGDYWAAVVSTRNAAPNATTAEYWSSMRFTGTLDQIMREISASLAREAADYPEAAPSRVFMVNVSAADRRLRKRAAALGIALSID